MKEKLILDAGIFALLLLCMEYNATGSFLHELIGVILFAGLLFHIVLNIKYYKILKKDRIKKLGIKGKISLILNILLPVSLVTMMASSCVISKDIFRFMNIETGNYEFWRVLHIVSACVMLTVSFVHILMHAKMFRALIKKNTKSGAGSAAASIFSCIAAVAAGALVVKSGVHYVSEDIIDAADSKSEPVQTEPSDTLKENSNPALPVETEESIPEGNPALPAETEKEIRDAVDGMIKDSDSDDKISEQPVNDTPTLEEYLGGLICTGCGRRCSLLAPQCGKGERQAEEAESEYENTYSIQDNGNDEETITGQPAADTPSLEEYLGGLVCTGCGRRCSLLAPQCGKGERQSEEAESEYYSTYSVQ